MQTRSVPAAQRLHGPLAVPDARGDRLHVEGVTDDHALEAKLVTQQAEQLAG